MGYLDQIVRTYLFWILSSQQGMQNGGKGFLSIILAGLGILVKCS